MDIFNINPMLFDLKTSYEGNKIVSKIKLLFYMEDYKSIVLPCLIVRSYTELLKSVRYKYYMSYQS